MKEDNIFYLTDKSVLNIKRGFVYEGHRRRRGLAKLFSSGEDKHFVHHCDELLKEYPEEHLLKNAIYKNLVSLLSEHKKNSVNLWGEEKSPERSVEEYGGKNASIVLGLAAEGDQSIYLTNEYIDESLRKALSSFDGIFSKSVILSLIKSGFNDDSLYATLVKSLTDREKAELDRYTQEFPQANAVSYAAYIYSLRNATYREYMNGRYIDEIVDYIRYLRSDEYEETATDENYKSLAIVILIMFIGALIITKLS